MTSFWKFALIVLAGSCLLDAPGRASAFEADSCRVNPDVFSEFEEPVTVIPQKSIRDIEAKNMAADKVLGIEKIVPFGRNNRNWEELKGMYREGDCIAYFRTGPKSWQCPCGGQEGYVLIRDGEPIFMVRTRVS